MCQRFVGKRLELEPAGRASDHSAGLTPAKGEEEGGLGETAVTL